ncbi:AAC(3) family N-acetyltransferase [Enterovibrio norvegicus]|uniref:AAC(3) family N-acetyltransferase n=1 Tax=Enterovibrio norvegicus TaxID=188144 RepID=UPI000C83E22A|nr:AAC(3) family N-acetyltransferase [Enterovibrio norvegicus]PMN72140.1 AAC(3) family N-acetyltransferase [Enterovibrio norvegicus]
MTTTRSDVQDAIKALALENKVLFVHSSVRSFGHLDGGPDTLIDALLEAGCTVVVPTFNYDTLCLPPNGDPYRQNGYRGELHLEETVIFCGDKNRLEPSMGAISKALLHRPDRIRSTHPICSYAAVGPHAEAILSKQTNDDIYGLYACDEANDAIVVSMGVPLTTITPIHFAEQLAGRNLLRRWAKTYTRGIVETSVGSCSEGFNKFAPLLTEISQQAKAGQSTWTAYPLHTLVQTCAHAIKTTPTITHCGDEKCYRCADMEKGGLLKG